MILKIIAAIAVIYIIVKVVRLISSHRAQANSERSSAAEDNRIFTGCAHPGWCRYTNLGKAADAGYDNNFCFCEKNKRIVERKASCTDFLSPGCNNDVCKYANHNNQNHTVYCSRLQKTIAPQESCAYFAQNEEFVNMMRDLAESLNKK